MISAVVGVAVLLLLCYAVSYPLAKSNSPEGLIPWCAVACVTLSGVVSGALGCIFAKRVLPYAFFSGALLLIAFLLMSVAFEATQTESLAFKTAICVCTLAGSLAGGLLAQKNKKPSHKSNSAYHKHVRK